MNKNNKDEFGIKQIWLRVIDEKTGKETLCDWTNSTLDIDLSGEMYEALIEDHLDKSMYQKVGRWYE